jgi:hypothetical protein
VIVKKREREKKWKEYYFFLLSLSLTLPLSLSLSLSLSLYEQNKIFSKNFSQSKFEMFVLDIGFDRRSMHNKASI